MPEHTTPTLQGQIDYMRAGGAPLLISTIMMAAAGNLVGPARAAYGTAFVAGAGVAMVGMLVTAALLTTFILSTWSQVPGIPLGRLAQWSLHWMRAASIFTLLVANVVTIAAVLAAVAKMGG